MIIKIRTETEDTIFLKLTSVDILEILKEKYPDYFQTGRQMTVRFLVPTGGDYSGIALDIDKDNPIHATVYIRTVKESNGKD